MIIVLFIVFVPILWIISTSFKDRLEFAQNPAGLIPNPFSVINYQYMFSSIESFPIYMRNSFIVAFGTAALATFVSALAGYGFARMRFRGRDIIFVGMLVSMFIPKGGGLMALYELMSFLHLRNSLIGLILLFASSVPASIFIMRQTFLGLPRELEEAALIDGAGWFNVFWRIALPLATGGMVIVATLAFIGSWSDYVITLTMIDADTKMTISVGIQKLLTNAYDPSLAPSQFRGKFSGQTANAALLLTSAVPVILFYAVLQKWFMRGITEGALKF